MYSTESRQLNRAARCSPRGTYFFSPCIARANPPYFDTENDELINANPYLACARHEAHLTMGELFSNVRRLMKTNGHFYLVHRASRLNELYSISAAYGLQAVMMIPVYKNRTSDASGVLLEYCFGKKRQLHIGQPVYLNEM